MVGFFCGGEVRGGCAICDSFAAYSTHPPKPHCKGGAEGVAGAGTRMHGTDLAASSLTETSLQLKVCPKAVS